VDIAPFAALAVPAAPELLPVVVPVVPALVPAVEPVPDLGVVDGEVAAADDDDDETTDCEAEVDGAETEADVEPPVVLELPLVPGAGLASDGLLRAPVPHGMA